ncbi:unnamed protein product [Staurois parvus]|uniref:F-box domain-containing protein n=1 Tax=Staurois parvus TaxID=386267 RepID=A0ABN9DEQ3_9NEOB|nr:unnamed protein product [Staurois parvus]
MSNSNNGDTKAQCLPRNGLVKIPGPTNGLGSASITKGTPAVKNRICQPASVPSIPPPTHSIPLGLSPGEENPPIPCGLSMDRVQSQGMDCHLALDEKILNRLFCFFSACEKCVLAQVCKTWRRVLYQPKFWVGLTPVLHAKELYNMLPSGEKEFVSLQGFAVRGFDSFCLVGVSDLDICEFIDNYPLSKKGVKSISLKRSTITDAGLEVMLEQMQGVVRLELSGCNDFTEAGLWSSLHGRITSLSVSDCINVADDAVAAISQLLPNLGELNLQAYHVTDTALAYFTAKQGRATHTLRLHSCWEITNHGVVNVVHSLPNLTVLSLSGCSKVTDDGGGAGGREPETAPRTGPVVVPQADGHGTGVHRLRPAQAGGTGPRQVCPDHRYRTELPVHHDVTPQPVPPLVLPGAGFRIEAFIGYEEFTPLISGWLPIADNHWPFGPCSATGSGRTGTHQLPGCHT